MLVPLVALSGNAECGNGAGEAKWVLNTRFHTWANERTRIKWKYYQKHTATHTQPQTRGEIIPHSAKGFLCWYLRQLLESFDSISHLFLFFFWFIGGTQP